MSIYRDWSNRRLADYLKMVGEDYRESGAEATADDYAEAARRIREIEYLEEAAYQAGLVDAALESK